MFLQYLFILLLTGFLVWYALQSLQVEEGQNKWGFILQTWYKADKGWLLLMVLFYTLSNLIRAARWRLLIQTTGYAVSVGHAFLSLMIGYLVNLVVPRGGEISRCYNLYKLNRMPVEVSFGTVVVERIADLLSLVVVLVLAFLLEYDKLMTFLANQPFQNPLADGTTGIVVVLMLVSVIMLTILGWIMSKQARFRSWFSRIWSGFVSGILAAVRLEKRVLFISQTVAIWVLYFLMSYAVIQAFDETSHLALTAVLSIFAIGTIAMAAPLPGGTGSYHVLLPAGLVWLYQLPETDAVAFTFIFHGWQTLILIITGFISLMLSSVILRKAGRS